MGRKNELAFAELQVVLKRSLLSEKYLLQEKTSYAILKTNTEIPIDYLIHTLGGVKKIVRLIDNFPKSKLINNLQRILGSESIGKTKLQFGLSILGYNKYDWLVTTQKQLKQLLSKAGIASRYVLPVNSTELTTAQVNLGSINEYYIIFEKIRNGSNKKKDPENQKISVGKTVAVQDFAGYSRREYGRPFITPREGMIPLKLARMMLNFSLIKKPTSDTWILDPFCGTGSIAMEALTLGINVISSDISPDKVRGTERNLRWLEQSQRIIANWQVFQADATHISKYLKRQVDAVVSEPYLGPPLSPDFQVRNLIRGLNKLYLGSLKIWRQCLKRNGRVVIVIPSIITKTKKITADLIIDRCENVGYTLVAGPYEYDRPQSRIIRLVYILRKKG